MSGDTEAKIIVDGDISPLRRSLAEMKTQLAVAAEYGEKNLGRLGPAGESIASGLSLATAGVGAFALSLTGVGLEEFVTSAIEARAELKQLSESTGASVEGLSALRSVAALSGTDMSEVARAVQMLSRNMSGADDDSTKFSSALRAIGINSRELKSDTPENAILKIAEALEKYKDGFGKTAAVQAIFGKSSANLIPLLNDLANKGSLVTKVTTQQAEVADKLDKAWRGLIQHGREYRESVVSEAFMRDTTRLIQYFERMAQKTNVLTAAIKTYMAVAKQMLGVSAPEVNDPAGYADKMANKKFDELAAEKKKLAEMEANINYSGSGASAEIQFALIDQQKAKVAQLGVELKAAIVERDKLLSAEVKDHSKEGEKKKDIDPTTFSGKDEGKEKSEIPAIRAELEAMRASYAEQNNWQEMTKAKELEFWQMKRQQAGLSEKDVTTIETEMSKIKVEFAKDNAKQVEEIYKKSTEEQRAAARTLSAYEAEQAETAKAEKLMLLDEESAALETDYAAGIVRDDEYLARKRTLAEQELQITLQFVEAKKAALAQLPEYDPTAGDREAQERLNARKTYLAKLNQLDQADAQRKRAIQQQLENDMTSGMSSTATQMLTRQVTMREGLVSIWKQARDGFITNMITEPLRQWIISLARMLAAKLGFLTTEGAAQKTASAATVATKGTEATAVVGANAAEGATGAAASVASIPVVGWVLAGVAFASILAMLLGAKSSIKSARSGYDIPKGVNPMLQAHEEEMVLPAGPSNVMRRLAALEESGQLGGGGGSNVFNVRALDASSVKKLLRKNGDAIGDGLAAVAKNKGWGSSS